MTTIFANGTIAAGTTLSASSGIDQLGATTTGAVTNNGAVLFAETGAFAPSVWFYGNLINNGSIQASVTAATAGESVEMGCGSTANTLINAGTLSIADGNAVSGASLVLDYATIANTGLLSVSLPGLSRVTAYDASITNGGTILLASGGSYGSSYLLGNAAFALSNAGTFSIRDAGLGAIADLYYGSISNTGLFSTVLGGASTVNWYSANVSNKGTIQITSSGGTGSTVNLGGGNTLTLNNVGVFSIDDSTASSGATVNVYYGSITNSGTFTTVLSGASTVDWYNANVSNSGSILISSSGSTGASIALGAAGLTMTNTGSITVNEGGASSGSTFNSFYSTLNNAGSYTFLASTGSLGATSHWYNTVLNTGTMTLSSSKTSSATIELASGFDGTLDNAGTLNVSNFDVYVAALTGTGTVNIGAVGDLILRSGSGSASGQTINFNTVSNTGTLILSDASFAGKVRGFASGDHLDVVNWGYGSLSYNASTGVLGFYSPYSTTPTYSINIGLGYDSAKFSVVAALDDLQSVWEITYSGAAPCFLPGTLIATPNGERPVERIVAGDEVLTLVDGALVPAIVRWTGSRTLRVRPGIDPIDAYPVRIRRDAFAPGAPHKDLLVTSEHCLFVDGRLVPTRMLVNGGSISIDIETTRYSFHHVELDRHAILVSDGLPSESYLDTGNRDCFAEHAQPTLRPSFVVDQAHGSWDDAAAPLATDAAIVRPIWDRLAARSATIGHELPSRPALVSDADPHLLTEAGERIDPVLADGSFLAFVVPAGAGRLHLASRAARPSDSVGPFLDDRRRLGIKIGRIGVASGRARRLLDLSIAESGWYAAEHDGRWTDGLAALPIEPSNETALHLDVEILATGCYPDAAVSAPCAIPDPTPFRRAA